VFCADEVSESASSSDEDGEQHSRRSVTRRRWCLPGCDCERPIGSRKCACERRGSFYCEKNCHCEADKCRARRQEELEDED
jgi:hypothetical protein